MVRLIQQTDEQVGPLMDRVQQVMDDPELLRPKQQGMQGYGPSLMPDVPVWSAPTSTSGPLTRGAAAFQSGLVSSVGALVTGIELIPRWMLGSEGPTLGGMIQQAGEDMMPFDANLYNQVSAGLGSLLLFAGPGLGVNIGLKTMTRLGPKMAAAMGIGVGSVMESGAEAGAVYNDMYQKTQDPVQAREAARKAFVGNLLLTTITNTLGIAKIVGSSRRLSKVIGAAMTEGTQEAMQSAISSWAQNEDINLDDMAVSALVGAITGGGVGAVFGSPAKSKDPKDANTTNTKPISEVVKDIETDNAGAGQAVESAQEPSPSTKTIINEPTPIEFEARKKGKAQVQHYREVAQGKEREKRIAGEQRIAQEVAERKRVERSEYDRKQRLGKERAQLVKIETILAQAKADDKIARTAQTIKNIQRAETARKKVQAEIKTAQTAEAWREAQVAKGAALSERIESKSVYAKETATKQEKQQAAIIEQQEQVRMEQQAQEEARVKRKAEQARVEQTKRTVLAQRKSKYKKERKKATREQAEQLFGWQSESQRNGIIDAELNQIAEAYENGDITREQMEQYLTSMQLRRSTMDEQLIKKQQAGFVGSSVELYELSQDEQLPYVESLADHPMFKNSIFAPTDEGIKITLPNGRSFTIAKVDYITPDEFTLTLHYGTRTGQVRGKYTHINKTITLSKLATKHTITHEFMHFLEMSDLITGSELQAINRSIKKAGGTPNLESRARFIQNAFIERDLNTGVIGRALQKIADFIDAMINTFGFQTSQGFIRALEAGRIQSRMVNGQGRLTATSAYEITAQMWYSQMMRSLTKVLPGKATGQTLISLLNGWAPRPGRKGKALFKREELLWSGLLEWLPTQKGKVTKSQVLAFLGTYNPIIEEVLLEGDETKFKDERYMTEGGVFYKEMLIRFALMPVNLEILEVEDRIKQIEKKLSGLVSTDIDSILAWQKELQTTQMILSYQRANRQGLASEYSHWGKNTNVAFHVRFDTRETTVGKRVLHIAELQSDWFNTLRKKGTGPGRSSIPFKSTYYLKAIQSMVRYAAENNYDGITLDSGAVQAERWSTPLIGWNQREDGSFRVMYNPVILPSEAFVTDDGKEIDAAGTLEAMMLYPGGDQMEAVVRTKADLEKIVPDIYKLWLHEYTGSRKFDAVKQRVDKVWAKLQSSREGVYLPQLEAFENLYDKQIIRQVNKFFNTKSWGFGKFTSKLIDTVEDPFLAEILEVNYLPITDQMRERALSEAFPMYEVATNQLVEDALIKAQADVEDHRAMYQALRASQRLGEKVPVSELNRAKKNYLEAKNKIAAIEEGDLQGIELSGVDLNPGTGNQDMQQFDEIATNAMILDRLGQLLLHNNSTADGLINTIAREFGVSRAVVERVAAEHYGLYEVEHQSLQDTATLTSPQATRIADSIKEAKEAGKFTNISAHLTNLGFSEKLVSSVTSALSRAGVDIRAADPQEPATEASSSPEETLDKKAMRKIRNALQAAAVNAGLLRRMEPGLSSKPMHEQMGVSEKEYLLMTMEQRHAKMGRALRKLKRGTYEDVGYVAFLNKVIPDADIKKLKYREMREVINALAKLQSIPESEIFDFGTVGNFIRQKSHLNQLMSAPTLSDQGFRKFTRMLQNPIRFFERIKLSFIYRWVRDASVRAKMNYLTDMQHIRKSAERYGITLDEDTRERIGAYAMWQQPEAFPSLIANKVAEPTLSDQEMKLYAEMQGTLKDLFFEIDKTKQMLNTGKLPYKNNYMAFFRDMTQAMADGHKLYTQTPKRFNNSLYSARQTYFKHEKKRGKSERALDLDIMSVMSQYLLQAHRFVNVGKEVGRVNNLIGPYTLEQPMKDDRGRVHKDKYKLSEDNPVVHKGIKDFINHVAYGDKSARTDAWFRWVMRNASMSYIAFNPSTIINQPAAFIGTTTIAGPARTLMGLRDAANIMFKDVLEDKSFGFNIKEGPHLKPERWLNDARKQAQSLAVRSFDVIADKVENIDASKLVKLLMAPPRAVADWGSNLIGISDEYVALASWHAFARLGKEKHGLTDPKEIADFADEWSIKTQASGAPHDIAPLQRTTHGRAITLLGTFAINLAGFMSQDVLELHKGPKALLSKSVIKKAVMVALIAEAAGWAYEDMFPWLIEGTTGVKLNIYSPTPTPFTQLADGLQEQGATWETAWSTIQEGGEYIPFVNSTKYGSNPLGILAEMAGNMSRGAAGLRVSEPLPATLMRIYGLPVSFYKFGLRTQELNK